MPSGIIAGTAIYDIPGIDFKEHVVQTPYGPVTLLEGQGKDRDLVFLPRHGPTHSVPPHRVNYRANIKALEMAGAQRVLAAYAVGSINRDLPPLSLAALDDFLDFTSGREATYFDGGEAGVHHEDVSEPFCGELRTALLRQASSFDLQIAPRGTYVATNGPRLESPAEIRMFEKLGADVVGMTALPECTLAKELGLCFAGVAFSVNWAAGIEEKVSFVDEGLAELTQKLMSLFIAVLREKDAG